MMARRIAHTTVKLKPALKPLLWLLALAALALTFAAYLQPGLVLDVATRLWACF